ncbi:MULTISPECIES: hydrogenase maturation nickel metallochaperone HypA [unclassified Campylobacter]|uniref:hydrogenase maturation nickel metallochaperone HypA n=1 Tax=unclassified Campylobacter TaxID=2593542 RepID=UPI001475D5E6|nr:hydrogenase maturation nickel metallochaperone HypA [Campylobacter sp. RM9328]MBE3021372.1 hydrogenase maturation nickel metallochaperone HypA [Campylobacter sp. 7477a]
MHELSIAQNLLTLCEQNAKKNGAKKVNEIIIKIGRLSGVEPHYLQSAFDVCKAGSICDSAKLTINLQNIIIKCKSCNKENELDKNEFLCPNCGSNELDVIDGEDMMLMQLKME